MSEVGFKAIRGLKDIQPVDPVQFKSRLSFEMIPNIDGYNLTAITGAARIGRYSCYRLAYGDSLGIDEIAIINLRSEVRMIVIHNRPAAIEATIDVKRKLLRPQDGKVILLNPTDDRIVFTPVYGMRYKGTRVVYLGSFTTIAKDERPSEDYYRDPVRALSDRDIALTLGADLMIRRTFETTNDPTPIYSYYRLDKKDKR